MGRRWKFPCGKLIFAAVVVADVAVLVVVFVAAVVVVAVTAVTVVIVVLQNLAFSSTGVHVCHCHQLCLLLHHRHLCLQDHHPHLFELQVRIAKMIMVKRIHVYMCIHTVYTHTCIQ